MVCAGVRAHSVTDARGALKGDKLREGGQVGVISSRLGEVAPADAAR